MSAYERYLAREEDKKNGMYDAPSIRILPQEGVQQLLWNKVAHYSAHFPNTPEKTIRKLLEAQVLSGESEEHIIARYLMSNKSVKVSQEFVECYLELTKVECDGLYAR